MFDDICSRTATDEQQADGIRNGVKNTKASYPSSCPLILNQCIVQRGRR